MDFATVTDSQVIMRSTFPANIDGDLLGLAGGTTLEVGDISKSEARIVSVVNTPEGKTVKVKGYVYRDGQAVIEVVSSLHRGCFTDCENAFETAKGLL